MDPVTISLLLGGAGLASQYFGKKDAQSDAGQNIAMQQAAMQQARAQAVEALRQSQATRVDQFGNELKYDGGSNTWTTTLSPQQWELSQLLQKTQKEIAQRGLNAQDEFGARGTQAGEDYNTVRNKYFYDTPPSEEATRDEIIKLMSEARGTGDQALATLVNRQELRQKGNMPVINATRWGEQGPGQRLATDLLDARKQALQETIARTQARDASLLPAMKQFSDLEGSSASMLSALQQAGMAATAGIGSPLFSQLSDIGKLGQEAEKTGMGGLTQSASNLNSATQSQVAADSIGTNPAQFASLLQAMNKGNINTGTGKVTPQASGTSVPATGSTSTSKPYWWDSTVQGQDNWFI